MAKTATECFTYLWCIAINRQHRVLCKPFQLLAPLVEECEIIFVHLRIAIPPLRSQNYAISSIHKPVQDMMSSDDLPDTLDGAYVHSSTAVRRGAPVREVFPVVPLNTHQKVNIIVYLNNQGAYFSITYYQRY